MRSRVVQGDCARCEGRSAKPHHCTSGGKPACGGIAESERIRNRRERSTAKKHVREKCRNVKSRHGAAASRRATLGDQEGRASGSAARPNRWNANCDSPLRYVVADSGWIHTNLPRDPRAEKMNVTHTPP